MIATPVKLRLMVSALLLAGGLSACSTDSGDYSAEEAELLQAKVLTVTETAPTDPATALTQLDELALQVDDALSRGAVTEQRHTDIVEAIALVRGDLDAAVGEQTPAESTVTPPATPTDTPIETPTDDSGDSGEDESENDESDNDESEDNESEDGNSGENESVPSEEATTPANPGNNGNGNGNSSNTGGPGAPAEPVTPQKPEKTPKPDKED